MSKDDEELWGTSTVAPSWGAEPHAYGTIATGAAGGVAGTAGASSQPAPTMLPHRKTNLERFLLRQGGGHAEALKQNQTRPGVVHLTSADQRRPSTAAAGTTQRPGAPEPPTVSVYQWVSQRRSQFTLVISRTANRDAVWRWRLLASYVRRTDLIDGYIPDTTVLRSLAYLRPISRLGGRPPEVPQPSLLDEDTQKITKHVMGRIENFERPWAPATPSGATKRVPTCADMFNSLVKYREELDTFYRTAWVPARKKTEQEKTEQQFVDRHAKRRGELLDAPEDAVRRSAVARIGSPGKKSVAERNALQKELSRVTHFLDDSLFIPHEDRRQLSRREKLQRRAHYGLRVTEGLYVPTNMPHYEQFEGHERPRSSSVVENASALDRSLSLNCSFLGRSQSRNDSTVSLGKVSYETLALPFPNGTSRGGDDGDVSGIQHVSPIARARGNKNNNTTINASSYQIGKAVMNRSESPSSAVGRSRLVTIVDDSPASQDKARPPSSSPQRQRASPQRPQSPPVPTFTPKIHDPDAPFVETLDFSFMNLRLFYELLLVLPRNLPDGYAYPASTEGTNERRRQRERDILEGDRKSKQRQSSAATDFGNLSVKLTTVSAKGENYCFAENVPRAVLERATRSSLVALQAGKRRSSRSEMSVMIRSPDSKFYQQQLVEGDLAATPAARKFLDHPLAGPVLAEASMRFGVPKVLEDGAMLDMEDHGMLRNLVTLMREASELAQGGRGRPLSGNLASSSSTPPHSARSGLLTPTSSRSGGASAGKNTASASAQQAPMSATAAQNAAAATLQHYTGTGVMSDAQSSLLVMQRFSGCSIVNLSNNRLGDPQPGPPFDEHVRIEEAARRAVEAAKNGSLGDLERPDAWRSPHARSGSSGGSSKKVSEHLVDHIPRKPTPTEQLLESARLEGDYGGMSFAGTFLIQRVSDLSSIASLDLSTNHFITMPVKLLHYELPNLVSLAFHSNALPTFAEVIDLALGILPDANITVPTAERGNSASRRRPSNDGAAEGGGYFRSSFVDSTREPSYKKRLISNEAISALKATEVNRNFSFRQAPLKDVFRVEPLPQVRTQRSSSAVAAQSHKVSRNRQRSSSPGLVEFAPTPLLTSKRSGASFANFVKDTRNDSTQMSAKPLSGDSSLSHPQHGRAAAILPNTPVWCEHLQTPFQARLRTLTLYGNPIQRCSYYRAKALLLFPNLVSLDVNTVTPAERALIM